MPSEEESPKPVNANAAHCARKVRGPNLRFFVHVRRDKEAAERLEA